MTKVSIVDYGMGNILSVKRSFEYWGAEVFVVNEHSKIVNADYLVLPGVGAFKKAMKALERIDLIDSILTYSQKGNPFLGICLGMQMMMDGSYEFGYADGLGLISGEVGEIPRTTSEGVLQKVPHVGWNRICEPSLQGDLSNWRGTILNNINQNDAFYFVHSFTAKPEDRYRLADTHYGGRKISAVIKKDNLYGCQFHPEKSGEAGLRIIKSFLNL